MQFLDYIHGGGAYTPHSSPLFCASSNADPIAIAVSRQLGVRTPLRKLASNAFCVFCNLRLC